VRFGGVIQDAEPVVRIVPSSDERSVTVHTDKSVYTASSLVLCAGAWTNRMTDPLGLHLPLRVQRVCVWYWKALQKGFDVSDGFPTFIAPQAGVGTIDDEIWGLPSYEYPGLVKVAFHGGHEVDPTERDAIPTGTESRFLDKTIDFVRTHLKGLEPRPSITETCMYTVTPDRNFILDKHPKWKNIVIGAGFSGHGFKLSPVVGKVLAELAAGKQPSYCLDPFTIDRFFTFESKL